MSTCKGCGAELRSGQLVCLECGTRVSKYANRIISLYAKELIDYETAVFALGRNL